MTALELQNILNSDNKLTLKQVMAVISVLKSDCFAQIFSIYSVDKFQIKFKHKLDFYKGEINAFQICLDLLGKVEE